MGLLVGVRGSINELKGDDGLSIVNNKRFPITLLRESRTFEATKETQAES